jgi:hypothetical protein
MLTDLKSYRGRILVSLRTVIYGDDRTVEFRVVVKERGGKVSGERRDSALSGKVCADKGD